MSKSTKFFSDPVHGFVGVPHGLIMDLVQTQEVQRLRRIRQLGVGYLVYPGAEHTRFGHALGAMALMDEVLKNLSHKGTAVSPAEHEAALAVALTHDLGHGPFSHTLEHVIIEGFHHEEMSRVLLLDLNERFDGRLDEALAIFDNRHPRSFLHHLISSQLDMDRLDYLRRDAYYTGVSEGIVGVQRIIKTMRVHPSDGMEGSEIAIESKGVYAIENFIVSRRLMYWQVYLHKTVLSGDHLLKAIFRRVRVLLETRPESVRAGSPVLLFFLARKVVASEISLPEIRFNFCKLDDADVVYSLKRWSESDDVILKDLCLRFLQRDFFRVAFLRQLPDPDQVARWREIVSSWKGAGITSSIEESADYYLTVDRSHHSAYEQNVANSIRIIRSDGTLQDLSEVPEATAIAALTRRTSRPYVCYPKEITALDSEVKKLST